MAPLTFSDAVYYSVPLVDAHEAVFKPRNLVGDILVYLFIARVHGVPAFLERVGAFVQSLLRIFLFELVLVHIYSVTMSLQYGACFCHSRRVEVCCDLICSERDARRRVDVTHRARNEKGR